MGSWHLLKKPSHEGTLHSNIILGLVESISLSNCIFLCIHMLVLIRNSLCAYSQRPRSIRLKLLCVCGMISAFKQATVPRRSPLLSWRRQSYTSIVRFLRTGSGVGGLHRAFMSEEWVWTKASGLNWRLQATLICDTQIGYCNLTPRALVDLSPQEGDRLKY